MPTLVADSSCVIDLHKVGLLLPLFELPYAIVMPQSLLDDELIRLTADEKRKMIDRGLRTRPLDSAGLVTGRAVFQPLSRAGLERLPRSANGRRDRSRNPLDRRQPTATNRNGKGH